jgi:hypothetical protein
MLNGGLGIESVDDAAKAAARSPGHAKSAIAAIQTDQRQEFDKYSPVDME